MLVITRARHWTAIPFNYNGTLDPRNGNRHAKKKKKLENPALGASEIWKNHMTFQ